MAMAMGGSRHSKISVKCQKKCGASSESHEIWWNMIGIDDLFGVDHPILVSFFFLDVATPGDANKFSTSILFSPKDLL
jgi:hypothetical protein